MAGIGSVVIQFRAQTKELVNGTRKVIGALDDVDTKSRDLGSVMSNSLKAGVAGIATAAVGLGIAFADMAAEAVKDKQAADKLARTLKKLPGVTQKNVEATSDWVDQMELLTLLSDDRLRSALGKLVPATQDLAEAQQMAALAWDASVSSGQSYETIVKAMAKGADGNTGALKRMFPWLDAGDDKVLTMAEAMKQLNKQFGGEAKKAADQNVFGRLAVAWGQIKEAIGGIALPTIEAVADWFADPKNIANIQKWIDKLGEWAEEAGVNLKGKLVDFIDWLKSPEGKKAIEDFSESLKGIASAIDDISDAVETLIGWWNKIPQDVKDWLKQRAVPWKDLKPPDTVAPGRGQQPTPRGEVARNRGGGNVYVTVNNPKPERASESTADALRRQRWAV